MCVRKMLGGKCVRFPPASRQTMFFSDGSNTAACSFVTFTRRRIQKVSHEIRRSLATHLHRCASDRGVLENERGGASRL